MKNTLIKITPEGMDPEFMVVTTDSSAHEFVKDYAKDNGYPIEGHPCANRFKCILEDLERIRNAIEVHCPIVMKQPAFGEGGKPFNDELSQCFTSIEIACDEEASEVEHEWMQSALPTYEEYVKDMTLEQMLKMYHEKDIQEGPVQMTCKDIAHIVDNADWLPDFEERFKEYLKEREYIR